MLWWSFSPDDTSSPPHLRDIFDEMEEAMRAEWKRHLGFPFLRIYPGQLVKGEVVKVTPSFAYIHVGYKCEGEVRLEEVLLEDEEPPKKGLKAFFSVGDEIFSEVIKVSDDELILSLQTLRRIAAWEKLLALQRKDRALRATVLHVHRGIDHLWVPSFAFFLLSSLLFLDRQPEFVCVLFD